MKVLVVGGGGREHVICWKLKQDPRVTDLYCAPGNGGIASIATCVDIKATDIEGMVDYAKKEQFDLVFVAPDDPLAMGMVDKMEEAEDRTARFRTVVALVQNGEEHLFEGIVEGKILTQKVGEGGFGYDPVFAPSEGKGLAFAQMSAENKNAISHRGRAISKLVEFLKSN